MLSFGDLSPQGEGINQKVAYMNASFDTFGYNSGKLSMSLLHRVGVGMLRGAGDSLTWKVLKL